MFISNVVLKNFYSDLRDYIRAGVDMNDKYVWRMKNFNTSRAVNRGGGWRRGVPRDADLKKLFMGLLAASSR